MALLLSVECWLQRPRGARVHLAEAAGARASLAATSPDKVRALQKAMSILPISSSMPRSAGYVQEETACVGSKGSHSRGWGQMGALHMPVAGAEMD